MQEHNDKPNAKDEPTAESGSAPPAEAAFENPAGGGSAPSSCSGGGLLPFKVYNENIDGPIIRTCGPANLQDNLKQSASMPEKVWLGDLS